MSQTTNQITIDWPHDIPIQPSPEAVQRFLPWPLAALAVQSWEMFRTGWTAKLQDMRKHMILRSLMELNGY